MYYTTQGLMTADDIAEVRRDMDLDLCGCCESGPAEDVDEETGECLECQCPEEDHA